jgi:hypothetical protein
LYKDIILLTISRKMGNYCVAGVEKENGNWVRIVSDNKKIRNAVTAADAMYKDGNMPQIMDIIRFKYKAQKPGYHQPENHVLDNSEYWKKLGRASINDLLKIHSAENKPFLFYNTDRRISVGYFKVLEEKEKYSLILISPKDVCVHVKKWREKKQITMSFNYSRNRYWYLPITDPEFENTYMQYPEGNYKYSKKCLLVISLGDMHTDKMHYKLIAKVLNI